jgi:hypothetical protein
MGLLEETINKYWREIALRYLKRWKVRPCPTERGTLGREYASEPRYLTTSVIPPGVSL